jgi:general secretion pathway protein D
MDIQEHRRQLLVEATSELHEKVAGILEELRRDSDLFVVVRARFVDISDDFLEDIGVDYRNLGQRNTPWRTTYNGRIPDSRTGGQDPGFTQGLYNTDTPPDIVGRMQNILDGYSSIIRGQRVFGGPGGLSGLSLQFMMVDPYQVNAIIRAVQETAGVRSVIAPEVTAHNGQRVYVSVITQRSYIADYELVSGGTTFTLTEVADPIVRVNEEGVVLDVRPTVSADRKYITIDVQPTLATLIGGVISTILINLGTVMAAAMQVPIGLPKMAIQRTWTSVTVPDGGTVLLGGFRSLDEKKYISTVPIIGNIPILNLLVRRRAELREKRSLIILISAKTVNLRREELERFGP